MVRSEKDLRKAVDREMNKTLMKPKNGKGSTDYEERVKIKIAKGDKMNPQEARTLAIYKDIRTMQINCVPKGEIVAKVAKKYEFSNERSIYKTIELCNAFYGDVDQLDKHLANKVLAETYLKIANQFSNNMTFREKDEDTGTEQDVPQWKVTACMKALEQYQKILGLDSLENLPKPQPLPVTSITSDPAALQQKPKIVYVEDVNEIEDAAG